MKSEKYVTIIESIKTINNIDQVYFQTVTVIKNLYGNNDDRLNNLESFKVDNWDKSAKNDYPQHHMRNFLTGVLDGIKADLENNLIDSIEQQITGSIVADFLILAKTSLDEGYKNVGAVLGAAALEDALKRYATLNDLDVDDKDMSAVINMLKSKSFLKGPQAKVASSYVTIRNKIFHAEFDKIDLPEIKSLVAFTEEFILKNLS